MRISDPYVCRFNGGPGIQAANRTNGLKLRDVGSSIFATHSPIGWMGFIGTAVYSYG